MKNLHRILIPLVVVVAGAAYAFSSLRPKALTLTGIVTTNDVIVSPQVAGQIGQLLVTEGDVVKKGQLLATITPDELRADTNYYAQIASAQDLDQARAAADAARAKLDALKKQVDAQRATVALARANASQVDMRKSQVQAMEHSQAAAAAQRSKADVRLAYTEIKAPIDGQVDVRAVRAGEYVNPGQPVVTLVNPDDLWVRADVEESYIDRVKIGDTVPVRLPSGAERSGVVFYRGVDAAYATQRDVSRTKRDIKTFEVRLRVDNKDRALAVGMTAYVSLPVK